MAVEDVLGFSVSSCGLSGILADLDAGLKQSRKRLWAACFNPHSYAVSTRDAEFARALRRASYLLPDGVGVVIASRCAGGKIRRRVTGTDLFVGVSNLFDQRGGFVVCFLGSTPGVLERVAARYVTEYPRATVAACLSPPYAESYSDAEVRDIVQAVNSAEPDVLWVALTAPKQEKLIARILDSIDIKFAGAVGAVFDFYARTTKRPSPVFQRLGLEWLPRLLGEPCRLWRRMLVSAPLFLWHLAKRLAARALGIRK